MESGITNLIPIISESILAENFFSFPPSEKSKADPLIGLKKQLTDAYLEQKLVNSELEKLIQYQCEWYETSKKRFRYETVKFVLEWFLALLLFVLTFPVFILISLAIKLDSRGPVFYRQIRIGHRMRPFTIYKFRTMHKGADENLPFLQNEMIGGMFKLRNDPRITFVGRFLRRWSLDELPQFINVLSGSMALVGPRPLTAEDTSTVPEEFYARFAAKPGITGMWQALSRDCPDGRKKIEFDAEYVKKRSFLLDIRLLISTIPTVIKGIGAI